MLKQAVKVVAVSALIASTFTSLTTKAEDDNTATENQTVQTTPGYIRDDLFVFMHVGSSKKFKILGSINAGSAVELLQKNEETGYIEIKDERGRIGWVEESNFTTEPSIKVKLAQLNQQAGEQNQTQLQNEATISQLRQQINQNQIELEQYKKDLAKAQKQRDALTADLNKSQNEAKLKERINGAIIVGGGILIGLILPVIWPKKRRRDGWA